MNNNPKDKETWHDRFAKKIVPSIDDALYEYHFTENHENPRQCVYDDLKYIEEFIAKELLSTRAEAREEAEKSKNEAYRERDMLVCALSKLFPAYLARHDENDKEWEDDWRWIVYIELPTGQVSWHIHDSEREMFNHLEVKENNWDGHNTQRKYERLQALEALSKKEI